MDANDIVPIYRLQYRGPDFGSTKIASKLEEFMIKNEEKFVNGLKSAIENINKDNAAEFNKSLLYFEGCLQV